MINFLRKKNTVIENYELETVNIKDCIHFCGFKYGGQQYNPYETFIYRYHTEPESIDDIKQQFINFLKFYHPKSFNEAFGLTLSKEYPLWLFPWQEQNNMSEVTNYTADPDNIVDIITHFSKKGIPSYKIDQEFYWLIRALTEMKVTGYQPDKHTYIEALKFVDVNKCNSYLLLDGNHRTGALYSLGKKAVTIKIKTKHIIKEEEVNDWPNVKNGYFTPFDALAIFKNYFNAQVCYNTINTPSTILDYSNNYSQYI